MLHGFIIDLTRGGWRVGSVMDCRCLAACGHLVIHDSQMQRAAEGLMNDGMIKSPLKLATDKCKVMHMRKNNSTPTSS